MRVVELRGKSRLAFTLSVMLVLTLIGPLGGGVAMANHGNATLNLEPETGTKGVGEQHSLTATISQTSSNTITIDFENENGPNDPDDSVSRTTIDAECTIPAGQTSCQHTYTGTVAGTDTWRAWIDHDNVQGTFDGDSMEPRMDSAVPPSDAVDGSCPGAPAPDEQGEPDCTDVVQVTWGAGPPATLDCDDAGPPNTEQETNPVSGSGSTETYTCTVRDSGGNPTSMAGGNPVFVRGENETAINDPDGPPEGASYGSPDYECDPETDGQCTIDVPANEGETGTTTVCFWVSNVADPAGACGAEPVSEAQTPNAGDDPNDLADKVEKTWETRVPSGLDAEPETDSNELGQQHQITAAVYDQFGEPFTQTTTTVNFEFFQGSPSDTDNSSTTNSPDRTCTTSTSNGQCSISYTQSTTAGTDTICVWIGSVSNTCDGEGLNDPDDDPGAFDPPEPPDDNQDLVQKTWLGAGAASRLDCSPETDDNQTGTGHTVTCTATNSQGQTVNGAQVDAEATGAGDPDGNADRTSPDFTCTTSSNGSCSFTHTSNASGTTTYTAWLDADNSNASVDADPTEGRDEGNQPGQDPEPDDTDVVEKNWAGGPASRLDCSPETSSNQTGTGHTVTCTATESTGQTVSGTNVDAEATGAGDPDNSDSQTSPDFTCTTGGNGQCSFTHTSNATGTTTYRAWIDPDGDQTSNADATEGQNESQAPGATAEPDNTDVVTKTWTAEAQGRNINCEPESATNDTGETHTVTCTVTDRGGQPVQGEGVTFTEQGAGDFSSATQQTTNAQGQASATTTSSEEGTQTITGTITDSTQGEPDTDECDRGAGDPSGAPAGNCSDEVTKTWTQAPACRDGVDNDGDGKIDHPNDPGCSSPDDTTETGTFRRASRVSIRHDNSPHVFKGRVRSGPARCERGRRVVVKKVRPGPDRIVGRDRTNRRGRWSTRHRRGGRGRYYARVLRKRFTNRFGDTIICRPDRSRTIRVRR